MFIPGYGPGIAADVGSAIRGNIIDLWMPVDRGRAPLGTANRHDHDLRLAAVRATSRPRRRPGRRLRCRSRRRHRRRRCAPSSPRRCAGSGSHRAARPRTRSTFAQDASCSRTTRRRRSCRRRTRSCRWRTRPWHVSGASFRFTDRGTRRGRARGSLLARRPRASRPGRPDAVVRRPRRARGHGARARGSRGSRAGFVPTSRHSTRAGVRPGWKRGWVGIESPPLSALAVDRASGWPAKSPPLLAATAFRQALQRHGVSVANGVRAGSHAAGRRAARHRPVACRWRTSSATWTATATTTRPSCC